MFIFLTITTIAYGEALLPVSVASSCPRTPRRLCSTLYAPRNPTVGAIPHPLWIIYHLCLLSTGPRASNRLTGPGPQCATKTVYSKEDIYSPRSYYISSRAVISNRGNFMGKFIATLASFIANEVLAEL